MNTKTFSAKRLLSLMLALAMFTTMILPATVFAVVTSDAISSNLDEKTIVIGEAVEFEVSTEPVDNAGVLVKGTYEINSATAVEKLEYYETASGMEGWTEFASTVSGEFGPATGFPLMALTSKFRVTFAEAGTYEVKVSIVTADGAVEVCSETDTITVLGWADYTALEATIAVASTYDVNAYTTASYKALLDAIKDAEDAIDENWTSDKQAEVDALEAAINDAIANLEALADYSELEVAYEVGSAYSNANGSYTAASFAVLTDILAEVEADENQELTSQDDVDTLVAAIYDAIAGLIEVKEVTFSAVAVANDAAVDYAKANKIVLVFAEPVADGADVLSKLNIADSVASAAWSNNNTIYTLTLNNAHSLANGTTIVFDNDETIMTKLGNAMADTDAVVLGNLEEAYEEVTATKMAATIVKSSAKPGVVAGDKIVLTFNAPVYNTPATITVNGMTANVVAGTDNTVYEITLAGNETISDATKLNYEAMTNVALNGSFGTAVAPKALAAVIIDNDGTAKTAGDQIVVVFDKATNHSTDISALADFSAAEWNAASTELTLTVADGASIANGATLDISSMNIKDEYNMVAATGTTLSLAGSFGTVIAPAVKRMTAVDVDGTKKTEGDLVVIVFDRPTNGSADISALTDFVSAEWNAAYTELTLTVGADAAIENGATLDISSMGIMDKDNIVAATNTSMVVAGSFGTVTAPVALRAYAVDNDGTHLVYNTIDNVVYKDQIIVVFDTPTNKASDISKISIVGTGYTATLGTKAELDWEEDGTKLVITLGQDTVIKNGATIDLTNLGIKDRDNIVAADSASLELDIEGSFGYTTRPKITKAVAFSQGELDYIRIFFNTQVKVVAEVGVTTSFSMTNIIREELNTSVPGLTYYEFVMPKDGHGDFISKQYTISLTGIADADTESYMLDTAPVEIIGGFVSPITPELLSVTAISESGSGIAKSGDKIVAVFNTEVSLGSVSIEGVTSGQYDSPVYAKDANNNDIKNVVEIKLTENDLPIVIDTTEITFTGFLDYATHSVELPRTVKKVGGSFGNLIVPEILSATAISESGSGIAKVGDKIVIVFNTNVDVADKTNVFVYTYTLQSTDFVNGVCRYNPGDAIELTVKSSATGREYTRSAVIGGSYGFAQPVSVKSVTLSEDEGYETITVIFDGETNQQSINTGKLFNNNFYMNGNEKVFFLGNIVSATWVNASTLKIRLEHPILTSGLRLNLSDLEIKDQATETNITGLESLEVKGYIVPVVEDVVAANGQIIITFSSRTNGVANISNFTSLLGVGATTAWSDYNRKLTITLGSDYTIRSNGYIVLNGMGITDGFTGEHSVIGEYLVHGDIASSKLSVTSVKAQSTKKDVETAQKGDTITIKFSSATDLKGFALGTPISASDVATFISVEGGNEAAFGTGYTAIWTDYDKLVINLGGSTSTTDGDTTITTGVDPSIAVGDIITIKDVKYANGTGEMDDATLTLNGSFDGREYVVTKIGNITTVGSDCRIQASVEYIYGGKTPTIVCVAYKGNTVAGIMRLTVSINDKVEPTFEFANGADITSAKIYVFDDAFSDVAASPEVLAKTIEITR